MNAIADTFLSLRPYCPSSQRRRLQETRTQFESVCRLLDVPFDTADAAYRLELRKRMSTGESTEPEAVYSEIIKQMRMGKIR